MDTNLSDGPSKQAHSINWICEDSNLGRTFIYNEIKAGRLIARKAGKRTIILDSDYRAYLAALPTTGEAAYVAPFISSTNQSAPARISAPRPSPP